MDTMVANSGTYNRANSCAYGDPYNRANSCANGDPYNRADGGAYNSPYSDARSSTGGILQYIL